MNNIKTNREILQELDECTNPCTRSVLKDITASRLRTAVITIEELEKRVAELELQLEMKEEALYDCEYRANMERE